MPSAANQRFKQSYRRTLDLALVLSLLLHIFIFATLPPVEIQAYRPPESVMEIVEYTGPIPPPTHTTPPRVDFPVETLDESVEEVDFADTRFDPELAPDRPPGPAPVSSGAFRAYDEAPRVLSARAPEYPSVARAAGLEGVVTLRVEIDASGRVLSAQVERSAANGAFDSAALAAIRLWRFVPARQSGTPVRATILVPIKFSLSR